jgi:hypothetical protein
MKGTETRKAFDRALQALPITQHKVIWTMYINWVKDFGVPETVIRVYKRYLMYDPSHREDFVKYLEDIDQFEEAARQLVVCVDDDVKGIFQKGEKRLEPVSISIDEIVNRGYELAEKYSSRIWGINHTFNNFYLKDEISVGLKYILGTFNV